MTYQSRLGTKKMFEPASKTRARYVPDYDQLKELVDAWKTVGHNIVLTSGAFDVLHIGHFQYLEKARAHGDLLIVGVDSDEKIRKRKGPDRPIVAEKERVDMLRHLRHVDVVALKSVDDPRWQLIKLVKPNVLIVTQETYTPAEIKRLGKYCGKVVALEPQATTSTTAKIRRMQIGGAKKMADLLAEKLQIALDEIQQGK